MQHGPGLSDAANFLKFMKKLGTYLIKERGPASYLMQKPDFNDGDGKREVLPSDLCLNQLQIPLTLALKSGLRVIRPVKPQHRSCVFQTVQSHGSNLVPPAISLHWRCSAITPPLIPSPRT